MKITLEPYRFLSNQSLGASFTSVAMECIAYYGLSIQLVVTGASGLSYDLTLQMSNDGTNWVNVPTDTADAVNPATYTANGSSFWNYKTIIPFKWCRISGVRTSGTGVLNAFIAGIRV